MKGKNRGDRHYGKNGKGACGGDNGGTVCLFGMLKFQSVVPVPFFREQIVPVMVFV